MWGRNTARRFFIIRRIKNPRLKRRSERLARAANSIARSSPKLKLPLNSGAPKNITSAIWKSAANRTARSERMAGEVVRTKNFVADAANFIVDLAHKALAERHEFRIALSGGNTPRPVYSEIARIGRDLPWERTLITFGDERCVPPDDAQSNFRMAREALFVPASVPEKSIMRMRGEIDPAIAAQQYQDDVDLLATQRGEQIYRHDLILLGLGDD